MQESSIKSAITGSARIVDRRRLPLTACISLVLCASAVRAQVARSQQIATDLRAQWNIAVATLNANNAGVTVQTTGAPNNITYTPTGAAAVA